MVKVKETNKRVWHGYIDWVGNDNFVAILNDGSSERCREEIFSKGEVSPRYEPLIKVGQRLMWIKATEVESHKVQHVEYFEFYTENPREDGLASEEIIAKERDEWV